MHPGEEVFNFDQCVKCQLVFLNPRVPLDELTNYYTSYYLPYRGAKAWGKYENLVEKSQLKLDSKRVKRTTQYQKISPNSLVLDIGCGKPSFLKACKDQLSCKTIGIDFSDEGWTNKNEAFQGLDLRVAEIKDLPSNLKPDVITMWHYLEHDYFPRANLEHLLRIAKSTTKLIIEVPNFESVSRIKFAENWAGWHTPRHTSLFSPNNAQLLLEKSGWKVDQILSYGTMDPYLLYWMSEMEKRKIDWDKNMEGEFYSFLVGMFFFLPKKWFEKKQSLGIMTVIASPA